MVDKYDEMQDAIIAAYDIARTVVVLDQVKLVNLLTQIEFKLKPFIPIPICDVCQKENESEEPLTPCDRCAEMMCDICPYSDDGLLHCRGCHAIHVASLKKDDVIILPMKTIRKHK